MATIGAYFCQGVLNHQHWHLWGPAAGFAGAVAVPTGTSVFTASSGAGAPPGMAGSAGVADAGGGASIAGGSGCEDAVGAGVAGGSGAGKTAARLPGIR